MIEPTPEDKALTLMNGVLNRFKAHDRLKLKAYYQLARFFSNRNSVCPCKLAVYRLILKQRAFLYLKVEEHDGV